MKTDKKKWMIPKSIKFSAEKLKEAKKKDKLKLLPAKCREQLDKLLEE